MSMRPQPVPQQILEYWIDCSDSCTKHGRSLQALKNGQVDAVVIDNAPAQEFVAANPGLVILDTSYAEEDYAIGLAKGSALEDAVNAALEELKADGTLQSIVDKYITAE